MTDVVSIQEVARRLDREAEAWARTLFPNGRLEGHDWVEASTAAGGYGDSLKITVSGPRQGRWKWFADGAGGDILDLIARFQFEGDKRAAFAWARQRLGESGRRAAGAAARRREPAPRQEEPDAEADAERKRKAAQALWLSAQASLKGTPAEAYLAARGIDLGALGRQPAALRYHPACRHPVAGPRPAILAAYMREGLGFAGVHRQWLNVNKAGVVDDGLERRAKLSYGHLDGAAIRVWRGASGKPLAKAPAGEAAIVTEGLEDALTLALAVPEYRILCAVSLSNMGRLALPAHVGRVLIAVDNDPETDARGRPHAARRALARAIKHFQSHGHEVGLIRAPGRAKDVNAYLRQAREAG